MNMTEEILYFWLSHSGMGAAKKLKLTEEFGITELFSKVGSDKKLCDYIGEDNYEKLKMLKNEAVLEAELEKAYKCGASFISIAHKDYPERLKESGTHPPILLYYKGDIGLLKTNCVAVVGTRHSSAYGRAVAEKIGEDLSEYDFTTVSGLATGIDAYAQEAVLKIGGKTIAVLGSGLARMSPMSNFRLFEQICAQGLVLSEYPVDFQGAKHTFPERNRIVAGISEACIVVEAPERSGALITADIALETGKEVFAVPGNITSEKSRGANTLLKNGAKPYTAIYDILSFFKMQNTKISKKSADVPLDFFEQKVYNLLKNGEKTINELSEETSFTISEIIKIAFSLEFKGLINRKYNNTLELRGFDN